MSGGLRVPDHRDYRFRSKLISDSGASRTLMKKTMLNVTPDSIEDMRRMARRAFQRLQHRPDTLRAFFRHVGLFLHRPI